MYVCICLVARINDAGREATGGPPQELGTKQLVIIIYNIIIKNISLLFLAINN